MKKWDVFLHLPTNQQQQTSILNFQVCFIYIFISVWIEAHNVESLLVSSRVKTVSKRGGVDKRDVSIWRIRRTRERAISLFLLHTGFRTLLQLSCERNDKKQFFSGLSFYHWIILRSYPSKVEYNEILDKWDIWGFWNPYGLKLRNLQRVYFNPRFRRRMKIV